MKKIVYTIIGIVTSQLVVAQVEVNNDLKALINQSFVYYPKVKEVENMVSTANEKLDIVQTNLPVVDGNVSYNYVMPKIVLPLNGKDFQFAPVHNGNANVTGSYMLFDFGRIKANVDRAKTDIQFAEHNVDNIKNQLAYQVATVYYNIIYLQRSIAIQDSVLKFLDENISIVQSKLKNGDAIKVDLLNIQATRDQQDNLKVDLQNQLEKQLNMLEYITGVRTSKGTAFDFDIALVDIMNALETAKTNNTDFILAKDKIKQALGDVDIAKTNDKPSVNVGAGIGFKNGYVPNVNEMRFNYAAGIALKIPIYDGGKTKRQVQLASTVVKQQELAVETLNNNYKKDIEQVLTDIASNLERIKNTDGQLQQVKTAEEITASRFINGVATNLDITNASTNTRRAELTKLQYQYQLCLSKVELARLLGYQYWK